MTGESELRQIYGIWWFKEMAQRLMRERSITLEPEDPMEYLRSLVDERDDQWIDDLYIDYGGEG